MQVGLIVALAIGLNTDLAVAGEQTGSLVRSESRCPAFREPEDFQAMVMDRAILSTSELSGAEEAAKNGSAEAQTRLGFTLMYRGGSSRRDPETGFHWLERAAIQGRPTAQFELGEAYNKGVGVSETSQLAHYWWQKAAKQGYGAARFRLAAAYRDGTYKPIDSEEKQVLDAELICQDEAFQNARKRGWYSGITR